jgi:hypothetical protein
MSRQRRVPFSPRSVPQLSWRTKELRVIINLRRNVCLFQFNSLIKTRHMSFSQVVANRKRNASWFQLAVAILMNISDFDVVLKVGVCAAHLSHGILCPLAITQGLASVQSVTRSGWHCSGMCSGVISERSLPQTTSHTSTINSDASSFRGQCCVRKIVLYP